MSVTVVFQARTAIPRLDLFVVIIMRELTKAELIKELRKIEISSALYQLHAFNGP